METYGSGNAPTNPEFLSVLREATARGVVIVNVTQWHVIYGVTSFCLRYVAPRARSRPPMRLALPCRVSASSLAAT